MATVGLNNYEKFFFNSQFGDNVNRLRAFRRSVTRQLAGDSYFTDGVFVTKTFVTKGEKYHQIRISKKKIDAYIELVEKKQRYDEQTEGNERV